MRWFERIIAAHLAVTDSVSHYGRMKSDRYFVWQEDEGGGLSSDDEYSEPTISGTTDLFTKTEFDPWVDEIGAAFDSNDISWRLISVQHEPSTGFIHHEWEWEALDGENEL